MGLIGAEVHHRVRGDSGLQFLVDLAEQGLGVGLARLAMSAREVEEVPPVISGDQHLPVLDETQATFSGTLLDSMAGRLTGRRDSSCREPVHSEVLFRACLTAYIA
jgi:hypothetical protein